MSLEAPAPGAAVGGLSEDADVVEQRVPAPAWSLPALQVVERRFQPDDGGGCDIARAAQAGGQELMGEPLLVALHLREGEAIPGVRSVEPPGSFLIVGEGEGRLRALLRGEARQEVGCSLSH